MGLIRSAILKAYGMPVGKAIREGSPHGMVAKLLGTLEKGKKYKQERTLKKMEERKKKVQPYKGIGISLGTRPESKAGKLKRIYGRLNK